jgi:predicted transcriptional regulator
VEEGLERSVKKMQKHGMTPARIAETLELSPDTVQRYLEG